MEKCAILLLAFPPDHKLSIDQYDRYDLAARRHVQSLDKAVNEHTFAPFAETLLQHVDPSFNSISFLALLHVIFSELSSPKKASEKLLAETAKFLLVFDPCQVRYYAATFSHLLDLVADPDVFPAAIGVDLLASALLRLDPTGSTLTSHHTTLVNVAYRTDNVDKILEILSKNVMFYAGPRDKKEKRFLCDTSIHPSNYMNAETGFSARLTSDMVLEHEFLVALCYLSQKQWPAALRALERVMTFPTRDGGCSKIMTEAHNKWVLTSLLVHGKGTNVAGVIGSGTLKAYNALGKPYQTIAKAFELPTAETLMAEITLAGESFWKEEENLGLVETVVAHYQKWQVLRLRNIYTKVSLERIRQSTQDARTLAPSPTEEDIENMLHGMIADGMLRGAIMAAANGKPAYLEFLPETSTSEADFAVEMLKAQERFKALHSMVHGTNERLSTGREYIRYLINEKVHGEKNRYNESLMFDTHMDEEDLMTGIQSTA